MRVNLEGNGTAGLNEVWGSPVKAATAAEWARDG